MLATSPNSTYPEWLRNIQMEAVEQLGKLTPPRKKDETWRYGDLSQTDFSTLSPPEPSQSNVNALTEDSIKILFVNDQLIQMPEQTRGVEIIPITQLSSEDAVLLENPDVIGDAYFTTLNQACLSMGVLIRIEAGTHVSPIIELIYAVEGNECAIFPRTIIIAEEHSSASIIERHVSIGKGTQLCLGVQSIFVQKDATLTYALVQQMNTQSRCMELGGSSLQANASFKHFSTHMGSRWTRQEVRCKLLGTLAHAELISANMLHETRQLDQRTFQDHIAPQAHSNIKFNNVLYDSTHTVFSGMIRVEQVAHETDAYQSNRNMILSPEAQAQALPGLEILADKVSCSHGTASSSINPEEIFYLQARGIPTEKAKHMIARGFLMQTLSTLRDSPIYDVIEKLFPEDACYTSTQ